jgi:hypothetical protein
VDAKRRREMTRRSYLPKELRVLFVGESPPAGGSFFYYANSILYRATRDAFVKAAPKLAGSEDFLSAFQRMGCYLEDLSLEPIDKLRDSDKREARKDAVSALARRLRGMQPRLAVIVVKGISPQVQKSLELAGLKDLPCEALPFPGQWHRDTYVAELSGLVGSWRRRRLLLPADPSTSG